MARSRLLRAGPGRGDDSGEPDIVSGRSRQLKRNRFSFDGFGDQQ